MNRKNVSILIFFVAVLLSGTSFFYFKQFTKPKYYVSICAIFRNEARFLKEWIEYHRIIGVEHFYLMNNLSEDNYYEVLKPYIDEGIVELKEWPYKAKEHNEWKKIQTSAYNTIIKGKSSQTFWLAIIDTDEFILPLEKTTLPEFLKDYEEFGGVAINWQMYGTSGVKHVPSDKTLIGTLTKKADKNFPTNLYVKSIVQPKKVKKMGEPHFCYYRKPFFHVMENKERFPSVSLTSSVNCTKIRINHYVHRDEDFFYFEKQKRYIEWFPQSIPIELCDELSVVEDPAILPLVPELEKHLF